MHRKTKIFSHLIHHPWSGFASGSMVIFFPLWLRTAAFMMVTSVKFIGLSVSSIWYCVVDGWVVLRCCITYILLICFLRKIHALRRSMAIAQSPHRFLTGMFMWYVKYEFQNWTLAPDRVVIDGIIQLNCCWKWPCQKIYGFSISYVVLWLSVAVHW